MTDWIEILKPNTKYITHNKSAKIINLIHPHWSKTKNASQYKALLKAIKNNKLTDYLVIATGFISLEGLTIVNRLQNYIDKLDNVEYTKFKFNLYQSTYNLEVKFK